MPANPRAAVKIRSGKMGIHWATASWSTTPATMSTATTRYNSAENQLRHAPTMTKKGNTHRTRSEEHTSELQSRFDLVCRLLLEKKKKNRASGKKYKLLHCSRNAE